MTKERADIIRWKCSGINQIIVNILSFIRLPFVLTMFGIELSIWFEGGITLIGIGIFKYIDYKYKTSIRIKKLFESVWFTISFILITLFMILFVFLKNYDSIHQESKD